MTNLHTQGTIKKALTFRASSMGDCLMAKHFLENVHAAHPAARCGIVVANRGAMIRDLLRAYPWIEIIEVNRRSPLALLRFMREYWGSDVVVTLYTGGTLKLSTKIVARVLARRGALIGYTDKSFFNNFLYDTVIPLPDDRSRASRLLELDALRAGGIPYTQSELTLDVPARGSGVRGLPAGAYIVVHFFAGGKGRSISPAKARELLSYAEKKLPGVRFVITGGAGDRAVAESIARGFPATVVAGEISLQELMLMMAASRGVISVDTGVAHIAAHLRVPLVVMRTCLGRGWWLPEQYGQSACIRQFSREERCAPHRYKDYPECIETIAMEEVAQSAASFFTPV